MKQCPHCNFSCEDTDIVCRNCGYLFSADDLSTPGENSTQQPVQGNSSAYQPQQPQNTYGPQSENPYEPAQQNPENSAPGYGFQAVPAPAKTSGMAIASMIFGISSICCLSIIGAIPGLILGIISQKKIQQSGGLLKGRGMAIAGIVLSVIAFVILAIDIVRFITDPSLVQQVRDIYNQILSQSSAS